MLLAGWAWAQAPTAEQAEAARRAAAKVFLDPGLRAGLETSGTAVDGWEILARWLLTAWQRLQAWLRDLQLESPAWFWVLVTLLLLILAGLIWHIVWTLRLALRGEPGQRLAAVDTARAEASAMLRRKAMAAWQAGDPRTAIRSLLLALWTLMEERRVLTASRGLTNREILGRLRLPGALARDLRGLQPAMEDTCYGGRTPAPEQFHQLLAILDGAAASELRGSPS